MSTGNAAGKEPKDAKESKDGAGPSLPRLNEEPSVLHRMLAEARQPPAPQTFTEKAKRAGKDVTYLGVVLVGLAVTGTLGYVIFQELFSPNSPNSPNAVFGRALKLCCQDPR